MFQRKEPRSQRPRAVSLSSAQRRTAWKKIGTSTGRDPTEKPGSRSAFLAAALFRTDCCWPPPLLPRSPHRATANYTIPYLPSSVQCRGSL